MSTKEELSGFSSAELFRKYKQTGDLKVKQELVVRYLYIVRSIAVQMRDIYLSFSQIDDIVNEGVLVLMNGIERFDPNAGVLFETYISKRIKGMIVDLARKQDWVPRSTRKKMKTIDEAVSRLYEEMGREPTEEEVAAYVNMSPQKYRETVSQGALFNILSLNMVLEEAGTDKRGSQIPSENLAEQPEESFLKKELLEILAKGIEALKEKEQLVIALYYVEELNMKKISKILQISEPRVSQIHTKAIEKLKNFIKKETGGENKAYVSGIL